MQSCPENEDKMLICTRVCTENDYHKRDVPGGQTSATTTECAMEIKLQTITCSWRRTILFPSDPRPCQQSRSMERSVEVNVAQEKVSSLVGINAIFFAINDQWHQAMQLKYNYLTHTCRAYLLHLTYALF